MQRLVDGYEWTRNAIGKSGASVYRLDRPGSPTLNVKHGRGSAARDIADESVRLHWLVGRLPAPEVRHYDATTEETIPEAWLLMTALPGRTARKLLLTTDINPITLVDAIETCPFDSHHRLRLVQAQERLVAGLVGSADFDGEHAALTPEQLWDEMIGLLPLSADSVVTHGDIDARLQQRLFDRLGIVDPDPRKLRFHLALDEYF